MFSFAFPVTGLMNSTWPCAWAGYQNTSNATGKIVSNFQDEVHSNPQDMIQAFPNPAGSLLTLETGPSVSSGAMLSVVSMSGRTILFQEVSHTGQGYIRINTQSWPAGMYNVVLQDKGLVSTRKVVVQK